MAHRFGVPVEGTDLSGEVHVEDMPLLVAAGEQVARVVLREARVVGIEADRRRQFALQAHAAEGLLAAAVVVEGVGRDAILHRLAIESDEPPRIDFIVHPGRVEGLADVGTVAHRNEALQVECHLLAAKPDLQGALAQRLDEGNEGLFHAQGFLVDGRERRLPGSEVTLQLDEDLKVLGGAQVCMQFAATEEVVVVLIGGPAPEQGCVVRFEPLAHAHAERQIRLGVALRQRNVFQQVQRFARHGRIGQDGPVLLPAVEQDTGPPLVLRLGGSLGEYPAGRKCNGPP